MKSFIQHHADNVIGVLSGFDRLVLRGRLKRFCYAEGMKSFLTASGILLKSFGPYADKITDSIKESSLRQARQEDRPVCYLPSSKTRKEDVARDIAVQDQITDGLVCVLTAVEPCMGYHIYRNSETHRLELRPRQRKCLHLYHYLCHPEFGFMHARLQTWFPFHIQVCINGREWLSRQMDQARISYNRRDNCFTWIEDFPAAQRLFNKQLRSNWPSLLKDIVHRIHPDLHELLPPPPLWTPWEYAWSVHQSEWATDVTFRSREYLQAIYPRLIQHAITSFGPTDVMRFLGRKINRDGSIPGTFNGEVTLDVHERPEGTRWKFWIDQNSGKMYDKWNSLRVETTINAPHCFKVFRQTESDPDGPLRWLPLRKGIADLRRRAEVSQVANERIFAAQAAVHNETSLADLSASLCRPTRLVGRERSDGQARPSQRFRALNPLSIEDAQLLTAVARPEFTQNGFRNRDLCDILFSKPSSDAQKQRQRRAQVTRKIRLLRAHGLIRKIPRSHRYLVTENGRRAITALLAARNSNAEVLTQIAA